MEYKCANVQEYSFQITMRQQWNDKRLRYKEKLTKIMEGEISTNTNTNTNTNTAIMAG